MTNQIVSVIIGSTREVVGTASISPPDKDGKVYANVMTINTELFKDEILIDKEV